MDVQMTWIDPAGQPAAATVPDLNDADRERRRLERGGCTDVRILTDPHGFVERPSDPKTYANEYDDDEVEIGRVAVRMAKDAGLPSSTAIYAGDAASAALRGETEQAWRDRHIDQMVAAGMDRDDAARSLVRTIERLIDADVYAWTYRGGRVGR